MKLTRIETDGTVHTPRPLKAFGPHPEPTPTMDAPPYIVMCEDTTKGVQVDGRLCVPVAAFCNSLEDARLFAAAPDLLAACRLREMLDRFVASDVANPVLKRQIEQMCRELGWKGESSCLFADFIRDLARAAIAKAEGGAD